MPWRCVLFAMWVVSLGAVAVAQTAAEKTGAEAAGPIRLQGGLSWQTHVAAPGARIDALAWLGEGVVVAGTRSPHPGHVFKSADCGKTWKDSGNILGTDPLGASITCLASAGGGTAYLLTADAHVWKSVDWGDSWVGLGQAARETRSDERVHSYGLVVLDSGVVLISTTKPEGGHVFRSEDGGLSWADMGPVSHAPLYRFEKMDEGILVNGWAGHVYKSVDEGRTWRDLGQLTDSPLYATEYLGAGIALQGAEDGRLFRSTDYGDTWTETAHFEEAADDLVDLGGGTVLYSTYTAAVQLYLSRDHGATWVSIGPVPAGAEGEILDHVVSADCDGGRVGIGGTKFGGELLRIRIQGQTE